MITSNFKRGPLFLQVCKKRSHINLKREQRVECLCSDGSATYLLHSFVLLYCVYTMFPAAPAAPFARNVACRGVLVIYFSDSQDLLRFVTFSYVVLRYP